MNAREMCGRHWLWCLETTELKTMTELINNSLMNSSYYVCNKSIKVYLLYSQKEHFLEYLGDGREEECQSFIKKLNYRNIATRKDEMYI